MANTDNPNSKKNTFVFSLFEAKDSHFNLQTVLSKYADQIKELRKAQWRGKRLTVFLFRDYEFLTKMFGISGAAGIHPCLWCNTTRSNMQKPQHLRLEVPQRSLESIKQDFKRFQRLGQGKRKLASKFNNVCNLPIWDIPLCCVCPPYLRTLLGITQKHHELLETVPQTRRENRSKSCKTKHSNS